MRTKTRARRFAVSLPFVLAALLAAPLAASAADGPGAGGTSGEVPDIVWPPEGTVPPDLSDDELATRTEELRDRLGSVFGEVVPQVEGIAVSRPEPVDGNANIQGRATFHDELGNTAVTAQYTAPGYLTESPRESCASDKYFTVVSCEGERLDDGSVLVRSIGHSGDPAYAVATSRHYLLDGSVTMFSSYTYDPAFGGDDELRDEVAVPHHQLDVLATDPELTYS
ncbi:hypothetical protein [Parasphingorhabdus pacifica]